MIVTVARMVHYVDHTTGDHVAAIVTHVDHASGLAELTVLAPLGEIYPAFGVAEDQLGRTLHTWHWPEREEASNGASC